MNRTIIITTALLVMTAPSEAHAQDDLTTTTGIITALYDVISGPAGPRDWDRFRGLFIEGAQLIPTACPNGGACRVNIMTPDEFAESAGRSFMVNPFWEVETHRVEERFGPIAHVFSTYDSRRDPAEEPFVRGINSIQLLNDGTRWWVVSVYWVDERFAGPIPERYR